MDSPYFNAASIIFTYAAVVSMLIGVIVILRKQVDERDLLAMKSNAETALYRRLFWATIRLREHEREFLEDQSNNEKWRQVTMAANTVDEIIQEISGEDLTPD